MGIIISGLCVAFMNVATTSRKRVEHPVYTQDMKVLQMNESWSCVP